jgi:hypothetical protein
MASRVVRARLDEVSEQALAALMREGRNESEAVRTALVEAGQPRRRKAAPAEEVRRLVDDAVDLQRLAEPVGHLSADEQSAADDALELVLGL